MESGDPAGGDTIAAIATPPGRGGIGIVRISGAKVPELARAVLGKLPVPRHATLAVARDARGDALDQGISLYYSAPNSYTGEDVLEFQGHGGVAVMHSVLGAFLDAGARLAEPGEYTRRAFLNDRLDLAQAEAVADLIDASSKEAARSALRSLSGEFSRGIEAMVAELVDLRALVEAMLDFPEEEVDPMHRDEASAHLARLRTALAGVLSKSRRGSLLRDGIHVVIAGRPNVGKSSLLNRLAGEDVAIVTPIAGTTRDSVRASITLEGVPIDLVDTAGLRETQDTVERIGIERSWRALHAAGAALFIEDAQTAGAEDAELRAQLPQGLPFARVINKIDLLGQQPGREDGVETVLRLSAKTGAGVEALREWLLAVAGWRPHGEGVFMARERHLRALHAAQTALDAAAHAQAFEIVAEELRLAHASLGEITGEVSADDLLGEIFSAFCIGK